MKSLPKLIFFHVLEASESNKIRTPLLPIPTIVQFPLVTNVLYIPYYRYSHRVLGRQNARFSSYLIGINNFLGANNKKKTIVLTPPVMVLNEGMKNTVLPGKFQMKNNVVGRR
jgi:hypothetical protein